MKLKTVILPNSLKYFISLTFNGCTKLENITLPEGFIDVGTSTFKNCTSLKHLDIPASVESIGRAVFYGCSSLEYVKFKATVPPICANEVFLQCPTTCKILVPAGTIETYKAAPNYPDPTVYTYEEY